MWSLFWLQYLVCAPFFAPASTHTQTRKKARTRQCLSWFCLFALFGLVLTKLFHISFIEFETYINNFWNVFSLSFVCLKSIWNVNIKTAKTHTHNLTHQNEKSRTKKMHLRNKITETKKAKYEDCLGNIFAFANVTWYLFMGKSSKIKYEGMKTGIKLRNTQH